DQLTVRLTINHDDDQTITPSPPLNRKVFAIWCIAIVALVCIVMGLLWQKLQTSEQSSIVSINSTESTSHRPDSDSGLLPEQSPQTILPKGLITHIPPVVAQTLAADASPKSTADGSTAQETAPIKRLPGSVQRAQFTSGISNKEPTDLLSETVYSNGNETLKIYFFTELKNLADSIVRHQWYYKNQLVVEIPIDVRGNRWRSYSVKHIPLSMLGKWTVKVQDENETTLTKATFIYKK
ncbi:MAG: hypothetical protein COB51_04045, partial [Moraxellaceae bacterium]